MKLYPYEIAGGIESFSYAEEGGGGGGSWVFLTQELEV